MEQSPRFWRLIATSLGAGYFPYGPGTMGALAGIVVWLPAALCCSYMVTQSILVFLIAVFTVLGIWSGTIAERYWGKDPSRVVIDETVGQWISLLAIPPSHEWWYVLMAFALFRFFDILKPFGVRSMERFKGGYGIMADDILAGIYGAVVIAATRACLS